MYVRSPKELKARTALKTGSAGRSCPVDSVIKMSFLALHIPFASVGLLIDMIAVEMLPFSPPVLLLTKILPSGLKR